MQGRLEADHRDQLLPIIWAAGTDGANALLEHWNGTAWAVAAVALDSPQGGGEGGGYSTVTYTGVAAVSNSDVWASGTR